MIEKNVLKYLTGESGRSEKVLIGFSSWKTMVAQAGPDDGIAPLLWTALDEEGRKISGLVQLDFWVGNIIRVGDPGDEVYLFEYSQNSARPQQLVHCAIDWANVGEIHRMHVRGDVVLGTFDD